MPNVTMAIDEEILKKARKQAVEKNTTLTAMIRGYLTQLATREDQKQETVIEELKKAFDTSGIIVGVKKWPRQGLHER